MMGCASTARHWGPLVEVSTPAIIHHSTAICHHLYCTMSCIFHGHAMCKK